MVCPTHNWYRAVLCTYLAVDALEELKHLSEEVLRDSDDTSVDDNHL